MQEMLYGNRNIGGELILADVVSICSEANDWSAYSENPAQAAAACAVLSD